MRPTERFHFRTNFLSPRCPFSTVSPRYFNFPREFVQSLWIVRLASDFPWQSRLRGAIRTRDNRANRSYLADPPAPLYRLNISSLHARRQIFLRAFSLLSRFRPRTSASSRSRKNLRRRTKQEIKETSEARFDKQFLLVAEGETEEETEGERRARERVGASGRDKKRMRAVDEDKTHSTQWRGAQPQWRSITAAVWLHGIGETITTVSHCRLSAVWFGMLANTWMGPKVQAR